MAEREKDDRGADQMLKKYISQEHNCTLDLKVEDNGRESESVINLKTENEDEALTVMEAVDSKKKRRKQQLDDLIRDWDEEEAKTELETKASRIKIDHDTRDADNNTRGDVILGPWRFELVLEAEQWGKLELPITGEVVEMTSTLGRRSLRSRRRGCPTGVEASH